MLFCLKSAYKGLIVKEMGMWLVLAIRASEKAIWSMAPVDEDFFSVKNVQF